VNATDIRDIAGPVPIPDPWLYAVAALGALLLLAAIVLGVRFVRARRRRAATPEARALARLAEARRLLDPSCAREYGAAVSYAVRLYIEERFEERAAHRTTEEFLRDLAASQTSPLASRRGLLEKFLQHCDLAKFARFSLSVDEMESLHRSALEFVRDAKSSQEAPR
jgi:hypothetical protein